MPGPEVNDASEGLDVSGVDVFVAAVGEPAVARCAGFFATGGGCFDLVDEVDDAARAGGGGGGGAVVLSELGVLAGFAEFSCCFAEVVCLLGGGGAGGEWRLESLFELGSSDAARRPAGDGSVALGSNGGGSFLGGGLGCTGKICDSVMCSHGDVES